MAYPAPRSARLRFRLAVTVKPVITLIPFPYGCLQAFLAMNLPFTGSRHLTSCFATSITQPNLKVIRLYWSPRS
jgi:hypothetical protein